MRYRRLFLIWLLILFATPTFGAGKPQAVLTLDRVPTPAETTRRDTHAKYEPAVGCYLGAYIDFDSSLHRIVSHMGGTAHQDPAAFEEIVGRAHSMYFFYIGYGQPLPLKWVHWLGAHDKFVHIALEPNDGLKHVANDAYLQKLADDMAHSGARIFLRFASEMNGTWTAYHRDPAEYRRKFKLVHDVMRKRAPNVAMVWCPYFSPSETIPNYYPGDDAVDWVGVNIYNVTYHNNRLQEACEYEHPCDLLDSVYTRYSARKPIMICEYAATHFGECEQRSRADFAARKIQTLYAALPRLYPRVKCINYFDSNTLQFASDHAYNDYSVTDDPDVTAAYRNAVSPPYFLDRPLPARPPAPPPIPMRMYDGDLLRGKVRLGCFARSPSDFVGVRYYVDGSLIYKADRPDLWDCYWEASSVAPGKHTLMLQALNSKGKVVAKHRVTVIIR